MIIIIIVIIINFVRDDVRRCFFPGIQLFRLKKSPAGLRGFRVFKRPVSG